MTMPIANPEVFNEIERARLKAHMKHGENSIERTPAGSRQWLPILVEEIGEVANALTYDGPKQNLRAELIDVLAVASAWVDAIDTEAAHAARARREGLDRP